MALQHIEEAEELSEELGGTDDDVKEYFFSLTAEQLTPILAEYGDKFGTNARDYATKTLPMWKSGRRRMSGLVAHRLFSLLPRFMPIEKKFGLVKSLWEQKCPCSEKTFYVGRDADHDRLVELVKEHLSTVVRDYSIPETIVNRFSWLAQDDVDLQQKLHNYFLQLHREVVTEAVRDRIPRLLKQLRASATLHQSLTQVVEVASHVVRLEFTSEVSGITSEKPHRTLGSDTGCLFVIALAIFLLLGIVSGW